MFRDREDAARQLAKRFKGRKLHDPLVLAIPRGGVVTGAVLARELGAELDVVLSRKLRAPFQPELAVGAVAEDGKVYLTRYAVGPSVSFTRISVRWKTSKCCSCCGNLAPRPGRQNPGRRPLP